MSTSRGRRYQIGGRLSWLILGILLLTWNLGSMGILMAAGRCTAPTFSTAVNLTVSASPSAVIVADFNGDGKADLAIADQVSNTIAILLGNGNGTFGAPIVTSAGGSTPLGLAAGDFNGDGKLDLVVANGGVQGGKNPIPGNVAVLLGNGNGTFGAASTFAAGNKPLAVAVGDFNKDGKLDLAVANGINSTPRNDITIFFGTGLGTFGAGTALSTNGNPSQIIAVDLNNDLNLDLVVPLGGTATGSVGILNGSATGTFAGVRKTTVGSTSAAVGDFDNDGVLDLVVVDSTATTGTAVILEQNPIGTFTPLAGAPVGSAPIFVVSGDFNNDGNTDVAVANSGTGTVTVLLGTGADAFLTGVDFVTGLTPSGAAVGDLNGDGLPDLAVTNSGAGTVSILLNACGTTTTAVTSSLNPSIVGDSVTLTATVTPVGGGGSPTGTITFKDGATIIGTVPGIVGSASLTVSTFTAGSHSITAAYGGDTTFSASTSPALTQTVSAHATTTALTSSLNPSNVGQSVTLTANVTSTGAGTITGTVTFHDGAATIGAGTISGGTATLILTTLTVGTHSLTASYPGDGAFNFGPSTSAPVSQVVNPLPTTTALTSSLNPSNSGQSVTFTATVSTTATGTPTGSVTFNDGATALGTGTLTAGVATFSTSILTAATHSITAVYGGDATFAPSTSTGVSQVVNKNTTTTALTSSLNPSNVGDAVTLTATVTSGGTGTITGTVTFNDGATALGTGTVTAGVATFATSALTAGTHSITAVYGGDAAFSTSTSTAVSQVMNKNASTTALTSSLNPSNVGQSVTLTATVSSTATGTPSGTVTFNDGA
ncbi:MAG: Ig-like domain repeat protein, partial [Acidobacteriia bacterium]|nr:Ig-like domain repeat protein [Terriglobia bacterium]